MSPTGETTSASGIRTDYLKLLVTQLRNQNPLEPMDNNEMASQLAQMSQLEQLENMNTSFGQVLQSQKNCQAVELIGKEIGFYQPGDIDIRTGVVDGVQTIDGEAKVIVGDQAVALDEIQYVRN